MKSAPRSATWAPLLIGSATLAGWVSACTTTPTTPFVQLGLPAGLDPGEVGTMCKADARPRIADVTTASGERVRTCSPIELTGDPPCEWACEVHTPGSCGNAGQWDLLVLFERRRGSFARIGQIALADHGPLRLGFRRTIRLEREGPRITLVAELRLLEHRSPRGVVREHTAAIERYRAREGKLRLVEDRH